ncbi:DNA repair protein RAD52 homolog isoform X3 [Aricia agestis]|uniref:DNA repair protein RAD52 homolog isoform X3 n=1 Tax=Aricia agestis TaxID=91739 RepID=UPI001C203839|nr:DNA repair protein RAD52 homolog isoform X3 [Aricia agestis]
MQRKPGFPVANCSIKMPDNLPAPDAVDEDEPLKKRQQLINFGHSQWGFNNWNWAVTKQDLDFVDLSNGKYTAGVVAFVSITVKSLDLHRENIGYATSIAPQKGSAIHNARKCAVTNALRETLLSFGGSVTTELMELLEIHKPPEHVPIEPELPKHSEPKNSPKLNIRKEADIRPHTTVPPAIKNAPNPPPVAKAHPMPVNLPPANRPPIVANAPRAPPPPPGPQVRPNSNDLKLEGMSEQEARAERKRRQRQAQEEFRQKQMMKQKDMGGDVTNNSLDRILLAIPSQDINMASGSREKRKSPSPTPEGAVKRPNTHNKENE